MQCKNQGFMGNPPSMCPDFWIISRLLFWRASWNQVRRGAQADKGWSCSRTGQTKKSTSPHEAALCRAARVEELDTAFAVRARSGFG